MKFISVERGNDTTFYINLNDVKRIERKGQVYQIYLFCGTMYHAEQVTPEEFFDANELTFFLQDPEQIIFLIS